MRDHKNRKKKLIISYKNLTDDLRELFKEAYPDGYKDYLQKTIKPNGEPLFSVPLETEDTVYMVKFDVVIDTGLVEEDIDKDLYNDEEHEEGEFAPLSEALEKEEGGGHSVGKLKHGAYEEIFEGLPEDKKEFEMANEDMESEFGDLADDIDDDEEDDDDEEEDIEPDDDELLDIEAILNEADNGEGLLREDNPPEERRGRKKKNESAEIKSVKAVRQAVKEARSTATPSKAKATTAKPAKAAKSVTKTSAAASKKSTKK